MMQFDGSPERLIYAAGGTTERHSPHAAPNRIEGLRELLAIEAWTVRRIPPSDRLLGDLVTTTTRVFLVGRTGLGKTMLGLAMAVAMAAGTDFLGWKSSRPGRVLYVDGEMPSELIKARSIDALGRAGSCPLPGNLTIFARDMEEEFATRFPSLGLFAPLNTEAGQTFIRSLIEALGGVDVVIFDNVMALLSGNQREEVPWNETLPLVAALTAKRIGQIWLDHTGHDTAHQYGTATKAWRFDSVGLMTPLSKDESSLNALSFKLSFEYPGKARRRTPDNWQDFETRRIRLRDNLWTSEVGRKIAEKSPASLNGNAALGLRVLTDACVTGGSLLPTGPAFPTTPMRGLKRELFREEFYRRITDRLPAAKRKAFNRMLKDLRDAGLIALCDNWAWLVRQEDSA